MTDKEKNIAERVQYLRDEIQRCGCECHRPGMNVMHFMPCCGATYIKLNEVEDVAKRDL